MGMPHPENFQTPGDQNKLNLFSFSWRRKRKKKILEEESKMRGVSMLTMGCIRGGGATAAAALYLRAAMSLMLFAEHLYMGIDVAMLWLNHRCRQRRNCNPSRNKAELEDCDDDDLESGGAYRPMVLVQISMFNEKQVYHLSIGEACGPWWTEEKLVEDLKQFR